MLDCICNKKYSVSSNSTIYAIHFLLLGMTSICLGADTIPLPPVDWLVDPSSFVAKVHERESQRELILENGLTRRVIRLVPNAATVDYQNLVTHEQLLRSTGPEARVTINGTEYPIGGLEGQPVHNYLKAEWIEQLREIPQAYQFTQWREEAVTPRLNWKKRPEWLSKDAPWPAPGKHVVLRFVPPTSQPAQLLGKILLEEAFKQPLADTWKTRVSSISARSSFSNEGKPGEIYTPPDTAVYAERDWPEQANSIELTFDAGDDTISNAWGPGLALLSPDRTIAFIARPNQQCFEVNGEVLKAKFNRELPCRIRVRLQKGQAICEAAQQAESYQIIATVDCPRAPTRFRIGKVGRGGNGEDYPDAKDEKLVRCHISHLEIRAAEPNDAPPPPPRSDLPEIDVHYMIYDRLPLLEKWW